MGILEDAAKGITAAAHRNKETQNLLEETLGEKIKPTKPASPIQKVLDRNKKVDELLDGIEGKAKGAVEYAGDIYDTAKDYSGEKLSQYLNKVNVLDADKELVNSTINSLEGSKPVDEKKGTLSTILKSIEELPEQAQAGAQVAVKNTIQALSDIIDYVGDAVGTDLKINEKVEKFLQQVPEVKTVAGIIGGAAEGKSAEIKKAETIAGEVAKTAAQYAIDFIPIMRSLKFIGKIPKLGKTIQTGVAGGVAAFAALDPDTPKFTELISSLHPKLKVPFASYLSANENDSNLEKRFKNAIDDAVAFGAIGGVFFAMGKFLKNASTVARRIGGATVKETPLVHAKDVADEMTKKIELEEQVLKATGEKRGKGSERRLLELAEFKGKNELIAQIKKTDPENLTKKHVDFIEANKKEFDKKILDKAKEIEPVQEKRIRQRREKEITGVQEQSQMIRQGRLNAQIKIKDLKNTQVKLGAHAAAKEGKYVQATKLVEVAKAGKGVDPISPKKYKDLQDVSKKDISLTDTELNIKSDNFHVEADIQTSYNKVATLFKEDIKAAKGDVPLTREKIKALAEETGFSVKDIVEMNAGKPIFPHEIKAFKFHIAQSIEKINNLTKMWQAGDKSVSTELRREIALAGHMIPKLEALGTTSSNMLREFKLDPDLNLKLVKQVGDSLQEIPVGANMEQLVEALSTLPQTLKAKSMFARIMSTGADMFREAWIAGMVSGTKTLFAVNPLGNLNLLMFGLQERALARGISMVFSGGKKGIAPKETQYLAYGMISSVREAAEVAGKTLKSGIQSPEFSKFAIPKAMSSENMNLSFIKHEKTQNYVKWGIDALGWTIRTPFNVLGATDDFFKVLNTRGHLYSLGARKAFKNGFTPDSDDFIKAVAEVTNNPTPALKKEAMDFGHYQTFTNELNKDRGVVEASGAFITEFANEHLIAKIIAPFSRIATNITKYTLERTPFAFAMHDTQAAIKAGGAQRQLALAKVSLGAIYGSLFAYMAHSGLISGNYPTGSLTQNRLKTEAGMPKNSLNIGGQAHPFRRVDIVGSHMAAAADLVEMSETLDIDTIGEMATGLSVMISENVLSKSYLTGVGDVLEVLLGKKNPQTVFQRFAGTLFPFSSLVKEGARAINPTERVINPKAGIWESFRDGFIKGKPFLKDLYLLPKRGFFGEVIKRERYFDTMNQQDNPALDALIENEVKVAFKPNRVIAGNTQGRLKPPSPDDGIELSNKQYDRLRELFGSIEVGGLVAREAIEQVIEQPLFKSAPKSQRAQILESIVHTYRSIAEEKLKREDEDLEELITLKLQMKASGVE